MNQFIRLAVAGAMALNAGASSGAAANCRMPLSFGDPHYVLQEGTNSLFWVRPMQVDADGASNAYHRDDPYGKKGLAIEYIGNGMTIFRNGEPMAFEVKEEENRTWISVYRRVVQNGWRAPPGFTVDIYGVARDENGNVCVGRGGRLISSTSLILRPGVRFCSQNRYVDALKFPGIVVPSRAPKEKPVAGADPEVSPPFASRGVVRGDLAVAFNPETAIWKGAFLYDTGPREKLGEGSIRLVMNLTGRKDVPRSAEATNAMGLGETYVVLFPGTMGDLGPRKYWTPERVERAATERFKQWGGGSVAQAMERLLACAEEYKKDRP